MKPVVGFAWNCSSVREPGFSKWIMAPSLSRSPVGVRTSPLALTRARRVRCRYNLETGRCNNFFRRTIPPIWRLDLLSIEHKFGELSCSNWFHVLHAFFKMFPWNSEICVFLLQRTKAWINRLGRLSRFPAFSCASNFLVYLRVYRMFSPLSCVSGFLLCLQLYHVFRALSCVCSFVVGLQPYREFIAPSKVMG
jgi:hypothetical protein